MSDPQDPLPRASDDGRYRIGEVLGRGALATVVALTAPDGRPLAGKILHDSHGHDPAAAARFVQEAALLRRLDHPGIVRAQDTVTVGGRPMLVMERVDGPTLAQRIAQAAPLPEPEILAIGRGIAAGLAHAHARGLIHRDLKPSNILLAGGVDPGAPMAPMLPKIADFGMARATSLAGVERGGLAAVGTPDYMAPEHLDPLAVDPRSDLYALGCILFEMATGRPPYGAATPLGLLHAHRQAPIPSLPARTSVGLAALITELLAKSPADRPQAADTVVARLDELADGAVARLPVPALVAAAAPAAAAPPRCATCGQPLLPGLALCLSCGQPTVVVQPGRWTIMVRGPGGIGDKIDVTLRDRLVTWITGNPGLGLDPAPLAKAIPRLPFTLARGLDEAGAKAAARALAGVGVDAEALRSHPLAHPAMRRKAATLGGRTLAIVAASLGGMISSLSKVLFVIPLLLLGALTVTTVSAVRRTTRRLPARAGALPPPLHASLVAVERVAPALAEARHRHGLRAVVHRALALADHAAADPALAAELGEAITAATVAAGRLDALDRELAAADLHDDAVRERLLERDTWSARLLELTAALDAFQARIAAAAAARGDADRQGRLDELRLRVAAIAEIEALTREGA